MTEQLLTEKQVNFCEKLNYFTRHNSIIPEQLYDL